MKKKIAALILCMILALSVFAGCGESKEGNEIDTTATAKIIEIDLTSEEYAFGVDKNQPELLESVNEFIGKIKGDGTFDEICNHYFGDGTPAAITSATLDSSKEQLVVATNADFEPFEYQEGDLYYGIDMEIAAALAEYLGKELVIKNMDFTAVCESVAKQEADIAMAGLTITGDREEYVDFSDSYYTASQRLIVNSENTEFDSCTSAASVEAILAAKDRQTKIGVQAGTTGQDYCEGNKNLGFEGFNVWVFGYKKASLAVQDLLKGELNYVIIDSVTAEYLIKETK